MAEKNAPYDDLNTTMIGIAGLLSCILTFVTIYFSQALFFSTDHEIEAEKVALQGPTPADEILHQQRERLASFGWVDREKETVAIPIKQAMESVVREMSDSVAQEPTTDAR